MCEYCLIKFASAEEFKNHIISNHTKNYNIDNVDSDKINSEKIKPQIKASKPRNLKQSPTFKGILIGIGLVIILFSFSFLYFSIVSENVFVMANDGMEPAIKKDQLIHYTKIPFADLQKNDIIVYVDPAGQVGAKVSRVIDVIEDDPEAVLVKSDNSQYVPFKLIENIYIGKVTEISDGFDFVIFRNSILLLFIPAFVIPIVVMKLKNRKMKADQ